MTWRHLELTPERLRRWWEKFHTDHPGVTWRSVEAGVELTSTDGTVAHFTGWYPPAEGADPVAGLTAAPARIGLILIRRGGYSIGLARRGGSGFELDRHKTGTRYVQGATSAGGWSQQRFARRRVNQAGGLVRAVQDHAAGILAPLLSGNAGGSGLVIGGDNHLAREVLADRRLTAVGDLPRREFPGIPDPRFAVLQDVTRRAAMVRLAVFNP